MHGKMRVWANGVASMRLWTYHAERFEIDDPRLRIDWTIGRFWNLTDKRFNYREALPELHKLLRRSFRTPLAVNRCL
jgi:hypothetical protein